MEAIRAYPPNHAFHLFHSHKENEEIYIVTKGEGEMQLGDEIFPIKEDTVIRVEPNVVRNLRSSPNSGLQFICVQARMISLRQFLERQTTDVTFLERQFIGKGISNQHYLLKENEYETYWQYRVYHRRRNWHRSYVILKQL